MKPNAILFLILILLLLFYLLWEYIFHQRNVNRFTFRIHVNGTRGKSSVTRLIRAGLAEGGFSAFAKTTGSMARMILPNGSEVSVERFGKPTILEQLKVLKIATKTKANVIVIECMALEPKYQWASESQMIQSNIGVITNIREDHLDIMGPSISDVAKAIASTVPLSGKLFITSTPFREFFKKVSKERKSDFIEVLDSNPSLIQDSDLSEFSYIEHKENLILALSVCESLGVSNKIALAGMKKMNSDPGALTITNVHFFGKHFSFANAMAANDPNSTSIIWKNYIEKPEKYLAPKYILFVMREDRPERTKQLLEEISSWQNVNGIILVGPGANLNYPILEKKTNSEIPVYVWEHLSPDQIFESLISILPETSIVFGMGNIVGLGFELLQYIKNRAEFKA